MDGLEKMKNDLPEMKAIRKRLHQYPELGLEETRTSEFIADHLNALGYQVHRGMAKTGVVGTLRNGRTNRAIGIRADMDGLPVTEQTGLPYASRNPGRMHACGHDGHMAMLLGAAASIAKRRKFDGSVNLIFQPAEENFGGAKMMIEEGLFKLFPCDAVFALHNSPELPLGQFALRNGPIMAAIDEARITVHGRGGHGAIPENTADPIVAGAGIVMALQTIVSRNIQPFEPAVITVGSFHGGSASNIIPSEVELVVGIRSFDPKTRDYLQKRIVEISKCQSESYGMTASVDYQRSYDATINHTTETDFVRKVAVQFAGAKNVVDLDQPIMGSEDFTYMLQACPGCLFFIGTQSTPDVRPLHHPGYDFNDDILSTGAGFWIRLTEAYLSPAR
ncbi:MAG: amidohydrolase [Desulfobacula sp.]|uniref:M20 aminoacylase family protein n=1 Tax=Desulfobacula sp. TaxID=2593537 RepID=UPI0025C72D1B|nr:M20 aminoacylase family protein [Desulfobacula sp.]MCD4720111.1 amidohydrolase [Desulfobacula sp.]